jgi:hypothetical protein
VLHAPNVWVENNGGTPELLKPDVAHKRFFIDNRITGEGKNVILNPSQTVICIDGINKIYRKTKSESTKSAIGTECMCVKTRRNDKTRMERFSRMTVFGMI